MPLTAQVILEQERSVALREPRCPHFGLCGGCQHQQYDYDFQLAQKWAFLQQLFAKVEVVNNVEIPAVIPSPMEWFYRNKMEFSFSKGEGGRVVCGLHRRGAFDQIVSLDVCYLFSESGERIRKAVEERVNALGLSPYHPKTHEGFLRNLVMREGKQTGEMLVNLVTNGFGDWDPAPFVDIFSEFPQVVGVLWSSNSKKADAVIIEEERLIAGRPFFY